MLTSRLSNPMLAAVVAVLLAGGLLALAASREIPLGALKGTVVAQESGNPIDVWVSIRRADKPDETADYFHAEAVGGKFRFDHVPAGSYVLEVRSNWRSSPPIRVTIEEGKTEVLNVELAPGPAKLDLYVHQHIFTPDERPQVTCDGYVESSTLDVRVYKVDLDALLATHGGDLHELLGVQSYYGDWQSRVNLTDRPGLAPVESLSSPITKREAEGNFVQRIDLPRLRPGMYVIAVRGDDIQELDWLMVTSIGLITKAAAGRCLGFVVDLKTGAPVSGAEVVVYQDAETIARGRTGADGLVSLALPSGAHSEEAQRIIARSGESAAFVSAYLSSSEQAKHVVYAYTDRPVYRPGQKVYFRGIVRSREGDQYAVPAGKNVTVEVRDPNDTLVYRASKTTDRFGCYCGDLDLNPETATGTYSLVTTVGGQPGFGGEEAESPGQQGTTFYVAAYAKPEFAVKITFPKKRYTRGEVVRAKIRAEYYFGAPVANAKVSYIITQADYWPYEEEDNDYDSEGYQDYGGYGESIEEGKTTTDANGEALITFRADWPEPQEEYGWDTDQQFTVEARVVDASRREASGSGSVVATRGDFALEVNPDRYIAGPQTPVKVDIRAVDYDKRPVANQSVTVVVGRDYWTRGALEFRKIEERAVTTDASGHAALEFRPSRPGDIHVAATAYDGRGNRITASAWVWCTGEAYEEAAGTRYPDLKIITDKKTYTPGETARVLINAAKPGRTALVTVEGDRIYDQMIVPLKGKSTLIDIPVRDGYKPNFYIGVCFVRNKQFANQEARVKVSLATQKIDVKIEPNKTRYLPGEKAVYKISATDANGRPVTAELSLGVVDEAIYAIRPDDTIPILDYFYSRKPNEVATQFSFPEIYLSDPDKAAVSAKMPRQTSLRIRKRFLDTAFWLPNVTTGPQGIATVSFTMPDNLTTWRATVRAVTLDTRCGQATNTVLAQQDMLVRLQTPRFLIQGDTTTISAIVHNYTGSRDQVQVSFEAPGLQIDGRPRRTVTVEDQSSERIDWVVRAPKPGEFLITVKAKGSKTGDAMQLPVPVYPHGEERQWTRTGAINATGRSSFVIYVRRDSIPEATRLTVRLAPSLAGALLGSLDYLARYPYGCTEQTTSSFLPDVILWESFKDLGISNRKLQAALPDMVRTGLLRLYRFQMGDGGWGWCEYGKSDPWMTTYVCYGLVTARRAGFEVNAEVLRRGLERLDRVLRDKKADPETRAFACWVFALAGRDVSGELGELMDSSGLSAPTLAFPPFTRRVPAGPRRPVAGLSARTLAFISLALSELGLTDAARQAVRRLDSMAYVEPAFVHWTGYRDYSGGDIETTALALRAVLRADPTDARIHKIVAWLMKQRRGNYWYSTRDTAMTLYAMAEFLKHSKELSPNYTAEVRINGRRVAGLTFTRESIFEPDREISVSPLDVRKGRNEIEIRKLGPGNLYYTAALVQWAAKEHIPATVTGAGVTITRTYHKMPSRSDETGRLSALGRPVASASSGDVIYVRLTINATKPLQHLLVEDFIPAGCEIADRGHVDYWEWDYWYVGRDVRDERISIYVDRLKPGRYVAEYEMRASIPGSYRAMPAQVFGMYDPQVRATTAESEFEIR